MQKALGLSSLINSQYKEPTPALVVILYDLNEADFLSEIISEDINKPKHNNIDKIRKAYMEDEIVQRIIQAKLNGLQKVLYDIIKNHFKLKLGDCEVFNNLLYVKTRLYVLSNKDNTLYTSIIKEVHISLPSEHVGRSSTYNCLS